MAPNPKSPEGPTSEGKTAGDLLHEREETLGPAAEGAVGKPVSLIVLCDGATPFDEGLLASVPHVMLRVEDDLIAKIGELHEENLKLRSLALIDNLTGLGNKRFFSMQLETEMARTKRTGLSCTLMMMDLDNFKCINDTFGHLEGDRFLAEFGRIMRDNSRSTDLPCRYGGDEFALIMPATSVAEALKTSDRMKNILAGMTQRCDPPVSVSIGISEYTPFSSYGIDEFVGAADKALYEAKGGGKNQVRIDPDWKKTASEDNEVSRDERDALFTNYR